MAFRADEAARTGYEEVEAFFIPRPRDMSRHECERSKATLKSIADCLGPVVSSYPTWHPLVRHHPSRSPTTRPSPDCGYKGLDHTRFFANGFVTCPYGDGDEVIKSVRSLPDHPVATITAERLDAVLYSPEATPILVRCHWARSLNSDGTVPLAIAMPLLLQQELPCWTWAEAAETWETMRTYFLGNPHGSVSSLFVNKDTGQGMKKVWSTLISTGMFGRVTG